MGIPKKLYKYEAFAELSLRNLKRQAVYFASPLGFNDPYDCSIIPTIQDLSVEDIAVLKEHYVKSESVPYKLREEILNFQNGAFADLIKRIASDEFNKQITKFRLENGIACLSETNSDLLMWAHYGGRYKGFCLEFDTRFEPFHGAKKVTYSDTVPLIDSVASIVEENNSQIIDLLCTKSKSWEYEKEWRVFHQAAGIMFNYPPEALTGIYFGPEMEDECLEIIALVLRGQNENVKLYQGKRSKTTFRVEFEQVNYLPHLEAKKQGFL